MKDRETSRTSRALRGGLATLGLAAALAGCSAGDGSDKTDDVSSGPEAVALSLPAGSWSVPLDVSPSTDPSQADWYDLGWQSFVALNWPALAPSGSQPRGAPDTSQAVGARAANGALIPTVWMTWRDFDDTMLDGAADPGAWNSPLPTPAGACAPVPPGSVAPGFPPMLLDMVSKVTDAPIPLDDINEASGQPLIDQQGWYVSFDIRLNESEYNYVRAAGYYDAARQIADVGSNTFKGFPRTGGEPVVQPPVPSYARFGATEVKASWRVLDPTTDIVSRYYTQEGYFVQPSSGQCQGPVLFGLVGLHILRLTPTTPSTWYWATFEQVDNTQVAGPAPTRPDGQPLTPSFALPGNQDGTPCGAGTNTPPAAVTGDIPWNDGNTPVDVCRVVPIPPAVAAANQAWQAALQGTVWQYYQLVDTINPAVAGGPSFPFPPVDDPTHGVNVEQLGNTTLETYTQTMSCMDCHGFAAPQGAPQPLTAEYQIFTFLLQNAGTSAQTGAGR